MKKVELLAPAGSKAAFMSALRAGADAIYLGGNRFGARAFAENFTDEELCDAIESAHLYGVKVYLTANILTRESEMDELVSMVSLLYGHGLDGVIIQDLGVVARLQEACPGLELHASTQMSASAPEAASFLKQMGICRIVPARELSLDEIRAIKAKEDIEIESFIHGAMCYSYSGRCLMSSFLGGRSGNRGRCAGTCRLPYQILDEAGKPIDIGKSVNGDYYPISMRDMCTLDILPELIDAGIDSFKIEGRMKKPEYVSGTVAIYRKYIDRYYDWSRNGRKTKWKISDSDRKDLLSLYIRSALCTGYYHEKNGRDMVTVGYPGYAGADEALLAKLAVQYPDKLPAIPISGRAVVRSGAPCSLEVWTDSTDRYAYAAAEGAAADTALNRPMSMQDIEKRLRKTGDTPFEFTELTVETDERSFVPVAALNELRRNALDQLIQQLLAGYKDNADNVDIADIAVPVVKSLEAPLQLCDEVSEPSDRSERPEPGIFAMVLNAGQAKAAREAGCDYVILDGKALSEAGTMADDPEFMAEKCFAALPYVYRSHNKAVIEQIFSEFGVKSAGFFVRTIEELEFLREREYHGRVITDCSVPVWNSAADMVMSAKADILTLPLELSGREMEDSFAGHIINKMLPVYGRVPMMITANCVRKTSGACRQKENGFWYLKDRKGIAFPVRTDCRNCTNIVYNSVPLSLHRSFGDRLTGTIPYVLLSFTDESAVDTYDITKLYRKLFDGESAGNTALDGNYTAGHYKKGAL